MRATFLRALIFALAVTAVSVAVDLLFSLVIRGGPAPAAARAFFTFRGALHGATLVFTALGALAGFALMRRHRIGMERVAALGACLGLFTLVALLAAYRGGGFRAMLAWLLVASFVASWAGARILGSRTRAAE